MEVLKQAVGAWDKIDKEISDTVEMLNLESRGGPASLKLRGTSPAADDEESHSGLESDMEQEIGRIKNGLEKMELELLFSGPYDEDNAVLSVHSGAGGVEAQDWAEMLERMYLRFAERHNFKAEVVDRSEGNEAGIKSSTIAISGPKAFGWLRSEAGVHRLVRLSPFNADNLRQTSFALVEVLPEMPEAEAIEVKDSDLKVEFTRSSGPGGQNVNKLSTAVRLTHLPTGIIINCQTQRSQHQNRETALNILKSKLYLLQQEAGVAAKKELKGKTVKAEWGQQIRSYVLQPYQMVKDHRTEFETSDTRGVLDGEIDGFVEAYLRWNKIQNNF